MPSKESVWDYPRPPAIEECKRRIKIVFNSTEIADSKNTLRVLEKSQPPVYYIPPSDVVTEFLVKSETKALCEFKGVATYWDLYVGDKKSHDAAWSYNDPTSSYSSLKGYLAFYAHKTDKCFVDDELVLPQNSDYYGGWITTGIQGPFKCIPGTKDKDWMHPNL